MTDLKAMSLEDCRKIVARDANHPKVKVNAGWLHFNLSVLEHLKDAERWQALVAYNEPVLEGMSPEKIKSIVDRIIKER